MRSGCGGGGGGEAGPTKSHKTAKHTRIFLVLSGVNPLVLKYWNALFLASIFCQGAKVCVDVRCAGLGRPECTHTEVRHANSPLGHLSSPATLLLGRYASPSLLRWRGACHALCGEVFASLVDPLKQAEGTGRGFRRGLRN